ncbi:MAG TPA: hypothetical protein VIJ93_11065 [bacterium]
MDRFKPTRFELGLAIGFYLFQFVGMGIGVVFCFKVVCFLTGNPLVFGGMDKNCFLLCKLSIVPGLIIGITCFTIPLYYLLIKPFFARERVIQFTVAGRNPNLAPGQLDFMNLLYKVCFFWTDVIYPKKSKRS